MLTIFVILMLLRSGKTGIINKVTDGYYVLNPLKITEKPNFIVGTMESDYKPNPQYFITYVFYYQAGSKTPEPDTSGGVSWKEKAENQSNNDCADETLQQYPVRRKCFCINHLNGTIYTTSYYNQVEQKAGGRYEMTLITVEGSAKYSNNNLISITLFSACNSITALYNSIQWDCNSYSYNTDMIISNISRGYILLTEKTLYASGIKLSIKNPGFISIGSKINGSLYTNLDFITFSFVYLNPTQLVSVKPIKLKPNDTLFFDNVTSLSTLFTIQLITVEENDFCSSQPECIDITKQYLTEQDKLAEDCPCIDQYGFIAKYAYCDDNKPPIIKTTTAYLDWDKMEKTQTPVPIISSFVYDPEGKPLQYSILGVKALYSSPPSDATFNEPFCGSASVSVNGWFCFNSTSGTMFSTINLLGKVTPDEVFTISIEVSDVELYPPRKTSGDLTITCQSLCTNMTSTYRVMHEKCNSEYFLGKAYNGTILTTSRPDGSSFTIGDDVYYITGLKFPTDLNGNYMEILITQLQNNDSAAAKYYFNGDYTLLDHPLLAKSGYVYNITFKNIQQNVSTYFTYSSDSFKYPTDFTFLMIRQNDYCLDSTCINYFKIYNNSLFENTTIKSTCAEVDIFGMKAKYGYCNVNSAPTMIKTVFYLDLNDEYAFTEVIPGNSSMYVSATNPLKYYFTAPDKYVKESNVTFPSNCSMFLNDFCINNSTGRIYTSSGIFGKLFPNTSISLSIKVIDDTSYPVRNLNLDLTLLITDSCYRSTTSYKSIVEQCVNYTSLVSVRENKTQQFVFYLPNSLERIISFEFNPLSLLNKFSSVSIDATFYFKGELNAISSDKMNVTIPLLNMQLKVPLNVSNMNISVYGYSFEKRNIFSLIPELKLRFLSSYICNNGCMTSYNQWLERCKAIQNCNKDFDYLSYNFDVCNDPDTTFVSKPILLNGTAKFKQNVVISSMIYTSPFEFANKYWLKDGVKMLPINNAEKAAQFSRESLKSSYLLHEYSVGGLLLNSLTVSDQGYYQCVVENTNKVISSEKIKLQLSDYTCAKANLIISEKWNDQYLNILSREYKDLLNKPLLKNYSSYEGIIFQDVHFYDSNKNVGVLVNISYPCSDGNRTKCCTEIAKSFQSSTTKELKLCDCCTSETVGEDDYTGEYTFPVTLAGSVSTLRCVHGTEARSIQRRCIGVSLFDVSQWENPDLLACPPKWQITQNLEILRNVTAGNVVNTTNSLNEILQNGTLKSIYDIDLISGVIQNIIKVNSSSEVVTGGILSSVDNLLSLNADLIVKANKKFDSSAVFLSQLNALAKQQTKNITISGKNLAFSSFTTNTSQSSLYIYSQLNASSVNVNILGKDLRNNSSLQAYIVIPSQLLTGQNQVYSYAFLKKTFFTTDEDKIDSVILSATLNGVNVNNSVYPISMMFLPNTNVAGNRSCYFWKVEDKSWSTQGCHVTSDPSSSNVSCECDHLTNFALILDVDQSGNNPLSLQVISWIGCGISIAGLLITIVSYSAFRKLRVNLAPKILINLCISLMATLVLFLAFVERTQPRILCQAVASLLQFFILSTFFWMAVEGLNLYRMFVKVFRGSSSSRIFMLKTSAFAWGTPLIFTIVTAAVKPDNLGPATDHDPKICVVRGIPFYFGILLPVCVVMVGNIIILILVLRGIVGNSKLVKDSKSKKNDRFAKVRIALSCSVLLGTTWIFAILAVGDLRDVFQWLFCIFNSLQGFFIFLFYTARNREVKHQWLMFFGVKNLIKDPRSSMSDMSQKTWKEKIAFSIQRSSTEVSKEKKSKKIVLNSRQSK